MKSKKKQQHKEDVASTIRDQRRPTREKISEALVGLVDNAWKDMQREVDITVRADCPPVKDLILLVLDGSSPLALVAPPELRAGGSARFAARLMQRSQLVAVTQNRYASLSEILKQPAKCGHLEYLATTVSGGVIRCTQCDLGMKPPNKAKATS